MSDDIMPGLEKGVWPVSLAVIVLIAVHFLFPEPSLFSLDSVASDRIVVPWKDLVSTFIFIYAMLWLSVTCHQLVKDLGGYGEVFKLFCCEGESLEDEQNLGTPHSP